MFSRLGIRSVYGGLSRCRRLMELTNCPMDMRVRRHNGIPPQPFDNMPFKIKTRFAATVFFSVFFGIGLWAPFVIVWYSMAKRSM